MTVLALESSCDETAVAILRDDTLLASEVASQIALHAATGGVVPEVASRSHLVMLRPTLDAALSKAGISLAEVDAFAATRGPGLATSLMLGMSVAKGLAVGFGKRFLAVGLIVSGGHTMLVDITATANYRLLGQTVDDAAGEAFDKVGKLLGLPYPGGPNVNRIARDGNPKAIDFPRSMLHSDDFAFSFSGLKTSVRYLLPKLAETPLADICASFQEAIVDVLIAKTIRAAHATGRDTIAISGGVSCNTRLREKLTTACEKENLHLLLADPTLCTDNAAMIGYVATLRLAAGETSPLTSDIDPNLRLVGLGVINPERRD